MKETPKHEQASTPTLPAQAFHEGVSSDGTATVKIGPLKVVVVPDGKLWFAQGLEIDYAAQGTSPEDAKKNFHEGLAASVHENLKRFGTMKKLVRPAPPEVWVEMLYGPLSTRAEKYTFTQETLHFIPELEKLFQSISFIEQRAA